MKKHVWFVALLMVLNISLTVAADAPVAVVSGPLPAAPATTQKNAQSAFEQQLQKIESSMGKQGTAAPATPVASKQAAVPTVPQAPVPVVPTNNAPGGSPQLPVPAPVATTSPQMPGATVQGRGGQQQPDVHDQAFTNMTNTMLPLSPAQIQMLRNLYDENQKASAVFPGTPPRPTATSISVDLSPGKTPPVIRLSSGFVTSLVFVDSTGAPWPIASYSLGNPNAFNIQWDRTSNILLVQAITSHRVANLAVILKGLNTPVMINLTPGQAAMDTRVDLRIPGLGPSAKPHVMSGVSLPGVESPVLLALLDGIPPPGARALTTAGCENCAWLVEDKLYLRMRYTLMSPAWISTLSSADGTNVYELSPTPLVLASYNGKTIQISIEGF